MAGLKDSVAEKPARLVGRQSECALIQNALDSLTRKRIFYFIASGGNRQNAALARSSRTGAQVNKPRLFCWHV